MTDLTAGRAKCLLPVGNLPLLWFPLKMLENCGFQTVIVTVPEAVQKEVQTSCFYSV
jgi:translation initiation factor eIF-2B subunit gamma